MTEIAVGGLARLSTCDWPGQLVATVFCQGCPWRCPYCHNPGLLSAREDGLIPWAEVRTFLKSRRGLLDGVVFSGGEPTGQSALPAAVHEVAGLGFRVGLHTGGAFPGRLAALLPLLDWVGFDVKAPFDDYDRITGVSGSGMRALTSLVRLLDSGVDHQLRTTVRPDLLTGDDMSRLRMELSGLGAANLVIQTAHPVPEPLPC